MSRGDLRPSNRDVLARALPTEWDLEHGRGEDARIHVSRFGLVLVRAPEQYDAVIQLGGQPVIIHRQFSVTDSRGSLRLRLGAMLEPWRWRRTLLNEGISALHVPRGARRSTFVIAARMARVSIVR
ncbi:hypothetical protein [Clavibacter michiganensis]|uniref:hypothetical protein n=1 Tax=Clavibacter michiganensis TaxID=28447 RepID=UPI0005BC3566|nr:hypothetical protein [Clavibacter michiganensis]